MTHREFLKLIEDLLELEPGTLEGNEDLKGCGWSSLAVVGFMALADEQFGEIVSPAKLARCNTPNDLAALLGDRIGVSQTA
ncbi:MAG TPA: acyl carrier protein [Bryobacteraceae bacterium]|nr:acyl carrier protein [Bryobacteraceae bacterium]